VGLETRCGWPLVLPLPVATAYINRRTIDSRHCVSGSLKSRPRLVKQSSRIRQWRHRVIVGSRCVAWRSARSAIRLCKDSRCVNRLQLVWQVSWLSRPPALTGARLIADEVRNEIQPFDKYRNYYLRLRL